MTNCLYDSNDIFRMIAHKEEDINNKVDEIINNFNKVIIDKIVNLEYKDIIFQYNGCEKKTRLIIFEIILNTELGFPVEPTHREEIIQKVKRKLYETDIYSIEVLGENGYGKILKVKYKKDY